MSRDPLNHTPQRIIQQLIVDMGLATDPPDDAEWPIYVDSLPDEPDDVATVYGTEGRLTGRNMIGDVLDHPGVQIRVRSGSTVEAYRKLARILSELSKVNRRSVTVMDDTGTDTTTYTVQTITPTTPPVRLGVDELSRRYSWTLNLVVSLRIAS